MAKYRFKTEFEFKRDNQWGDADDDYTDCPENWATDMLKYLGQDVPDEFNHRIESDRSFRMRDEETGETWTYQAEECVEKSKASPVNSGFIIHPVKEFKM